MLWLTCGWRQLGLVNVWLKRTMSPSTGISTSHSFRTTVPVPSVTWVVYSLSQRSHARTRGLRVSNATRPFFCESGADRCERGLQLIVPNEHLEGMTGHHD